MKSTKTLPSRLHHTAYVAKDLAKTCEFYEKLIGLPLIATWCESDQLFGAERVYCHVFFGLADGSALAFFQFANPGDQALFGPSTPQSPFHHIALKVDAGTQNGIERRLRAAGYAAPQIYLLEHGYCRSLYATDPNGMILELTLDNQTAAQFADTRRAVAHTELARWLEGDRHSNNMYR